MARAWLGQGAVFAANGFFQGMASWRAGVSFYSTFSFICCYITHGTALRAVRDGRKISNG
jgi:hypothetical protein